MKRVLMILALAGLGLAQENAELERAKKTLADWANLARYSTDNAKLSPEKNRVVFMGDSITDAWGCFASAETGGIG